MDQFKRLRVAEQLLKQGKADAALSQLRSLVEETPGDMVTLNHVGDLLARQKRTREAIGYYRLIADKFTASGYLAKAIAIHKKIVRLDADATESYVDLGALYSRQKLPCDARTHLERAGRTYFERQDWPRARQVYEELLTAAPDDAVLRNRLAEVMAAEGDPAGAASQFLRLGDSLLSEQPEDAESAYRRAAELLPDRCEPILGIAKSLFERGGDEQAFAILEGANSERSDPVLRGELIVRHEMAGAHDRAIELLEQSSANDIADETVEHLFRYRLERGETEALWERMDPLFESWSSRFPEERLVGILERLCGIEDEGHLPAIERLLARVEQKGGDLEVRSLLGKLAKVCRAQGLEERAEQAEERIRELTPQPDPTPTAQPDEEKVAVETPADAGTPPIDEFEVPAVAFKPADKEFVSGRLTQAEILENYGLHDQAIQQVREATQRFPGEVAACAKLVDLTRENGTPEALRDSLVAQAIALRAAGNHDGARTAARDAASLGVSLPPRSTEILLNLGLIDQEPIEQTSPSPSVPPASTADRMSETGEDLDDHCLIIDFDGMSDDEPAPTARATPAAPTMRKPAGDGPASRTPGDEMLDEVRLYLNDGRPADAVQRIETLRALGYGGDDLAELERLARENRPDPEPAATADATFSFDGDDDLADVVESESADDDLSAIAAALEAELLDDVDTPELAPDAGSEQSIREVFAAFRERVEEQVDRNDHRTHYDLGIGYKEMGLLSEAIDEFEIAAGSKEIVRESQVMIAICRRELGETEGAIEAYRTAVELSHDDPDARVALHYDLGELLAGAGDRAAALSEFRMVVERDPGFRDVLRHVAELES